MDKIQDLMNKSLQIADLKTWIESHNASTTAKTKKGKHSTSYNYAYQWVFCIIDLVQFIISTATVPIPLAEDIQSIAALVSNSSTFALYAFIHTYLFSKELMLWKQPHSWSISFCMTALGNHTYINGTR